MALLRPGRAPSGNAVFLFHFFSFILFLYTFLWHFGSTAATIPQSQNFGWFFKFWTFCGFSFQIVSLAISLLSHVFPEFKSIRQIADDIACASFPIANAITIMYGGLFFFVKSIRQIADDIACASFPIANAITIMYGALFFFVPNSLQTNTSSNLKFRLPLWLDFTLHLVNSVVAWVDACISERTFRKSSFYIALLFSFSYILWIQICAAKNKVYPYPFLDELRQPEGIIITSIIEFCIVGLIFSLGSRLPNVETWRRLRKLKGV